MINLLLLSTWFIPIFINAWLDRKGAKRIYWQVNGMRVIAMIIHAGPIMQMLEEYSFDWPELAYELVPILVFQVTSFWSFFELTLNYLQGRRGWNHDGLLYFDRKEKDSGWIDRFFSKKPLWFHTLCKIACFVVMVLYIIVIYYR